MDGFFHFLQAQPFLVIFGVVALGMWLGKRSVAGISLGSVVCIILAGLLISIWAFNGAGVSLALPDVLKTIFFNLFIFARMRRRSHARPNNTPPVSPDSFTPVQQEV